MAISQTVQIPVKITIKTTVYHGEEPETYELITFGRYQQTEKASYLRYEELMDVGNVNTTVKIANNEMLILRNGPLKMRMTFRPGLAIPGTYHTPNGYMEIETEAQSLKITHNEKTNEGSIHLKYNLSLQSSLAGAYNLEINYKEERK